MTAIFEMLFKYRPLLYEKGHIAFHPLWPSYITWLLAAAALVGAYMLYRRSVLPNSWRYGLSGLRAGAFLILLFLFLQPVLRLRSVIPQKNFVAVAYDLSRSMEIRDGPEGQSRLAVEQRLLRADSNPLIAELAKKFKLRFFRFSKSAERTESFSDVPHHGEITDIERTLHQVSGELATAPIAGIVLVTDGADNHSANLDAAASQFRARNVPVYTIGIGSPDFSRDTEVLRVTAPRRVLKDTVMEAEVSVRSKGYSGRRTRLLVLDRDRQLQSQEITLGSDGEVRNYKVLFTGDSAGPKVFSVQAEPLPGEILKENNDQNVLIRVLTNNPRFSMSRVSRAGHTLFCGAPRPRTKTFAW
jgi:hypothetical protein